MCASNKSYRIFNKRTQWIEESVHVIFDKSGGITNVEVKDDSEIDEILQIQRNK